MIRLMIMYMMLCTFAEAIDLIQEAPSSSKKPQTEVIPVTPPVRPPHKYLPYHPACELHY